MTKPDEAPTAGSAPFERPVGRLLGEHEEACTQDYDDEPGCERCHGDGMDPACDWLLPCPACQGEQRA
jgi:hypothetical protein